MKKLAIATLALGGLLSSMATVTAHAEPLNSGFSCGFTSVTDPQGQPGTQTGEVDGGPIVIVDDTDPTIVHTGSLTCAIHVGDANMTNGAADVTSVTGPETPAVVDLPPSQLTYSAGENDNVYLCTRLTVDGTVYYGDFGTNDPTDPTFEWATGAAGQASNCALAISADTGGSDCGEDPVCSTIDLVVCTVTSTVGALTGGGVPGVLEIDSEGDVVLLGTPFWDCPPYGS